jgi:hypothetical protein
MCHDPYSKRMMKTLKKSEDIWQKRSIMDTKTTIQYKARQTKIKKKPTQHEL